MQEKQEILKELDDNRHNLESSIHPVEIRGLVTHSEAAGRSGRRAFEILSKPCYKCEGSK